MSKYFIEENDTVKIDFPDGQSVTVKSELTQEDKDYIMSSMMQAKATTNGKDEPQGEVEMKFGKQAMLERAIVAWSFIDDAGKPILVTKENVSRLRNKYRSVILAKVNELDTAAEAFSKN